jgi:hypothetical protein
VYDFEVAKISEAEFARICSGIAEDREAIIKHNPVGTDEEVLLWMLLGCLNSYLGLEEQEMPCFTSRPDKNMFLDAILYILRDRAEGFDPVPYILKLMAK